MLLPRSNILLFVVYLWGILLVGGEMVSLLIHLNSLDVLFLQCWSWWIFFFFFGKWDETPHVSTLKNYNEHFFLCWLPPEYKTGSLGFADKQLDHFNTPLPISHTSSNLSWSKNVQPYMAKCINNSGDLYKMKLLLWNTFSFKRGNRKKKLSCHFLTSPSIL